MGTRFKIFGQPPFESPQVLPEVITVSSPAGSLGPGPSDDRMYVVTPVGKKYAYGMNSGPLGTPFIYLPPWNGERLVSACPNAAGHFDHYQPGSPEFEAAHLFGSVRFTLDVWERYLGQPLDWHFRDHFDRLEISVLSKWDNAQYGYGFLETGSQFEPDGRVLPFSLDFDVIAHEVGHAIVYAIVGVPHPDTELPEYLGFQESAADCVSLIAAMHFPSLIDNVLTETRGNLYLFNRLARFSEFSPHRQMRMASNQLTMRQFIHGWTDEHALAQPLTGAMFDVLVDVFHESLVARGLISTEFENLADMLEFGSARNPLIQDAFDAAYARNAAGFREALIDARDIVGQYLAEVIWRLDVHFLDYRKVAELLFRIDREKSAGALHGILQRNLSRRGIGRLSAGPKIHAHVGIGHAHSDRILLPHDKNDLPKMSYREQHVLNKQLIA